MEFPKVHLESMWQILLESNNQSLKGKKRVPARLLAKYCGFLQCKRLAYGCAVGFYSKPVYAIMNSAFYWNQYVDVDPDTRKLMQGFIDRIHDLIPILSCLVCKFGRWTP